jgi:L-lactate dehydrogenase (cytochrome)
MRERDPRNGMKELLGGSLFAKIPFLPDILAHPGWVISFLLDGGVPKLKDPSHPGLIGTDPQREKQL